MRPPFFRFSAGAAALTGSAAGVASTATAASFSMFSDILETFQKINSSVGEDYFFFAGALAAAAALASASDAATRRSVLSRIAPTVSFLPLRVRALVRVR